MSKEIISRGKEYLGAGLSVAFTGLDKISVLTNWKDLQKTRLTAQELEDISSGKTIRPDVEKEGKKGIRMYKEPEGLAIICGAVSGNLEVIDVDSKYDITGTLWEDLSRLIKERAPGVFNRLVTAQTKSGGYHIYYRSSSISGNSKLAKRSTTPEERAETYKKEIESGADEDTAKRRSNNDTVRALIETRGEGGYVIAPPTKGYRYLQGEPGNIPTITQKERDSLIDIAKSFNELEEVRKKINTTSINTTSVKHTSTGQTSYEDYNNRGDVKKLLQDKGFTITGETADKFYILRPGQTDSKTSGNFHKDLRTLRVFSTSTDFNSERAYSPSQVFCVLECRGDEEIAYKRLLEMGYGDEEATNRKLSNMRKETYKPKSKTPTQVRTEKIKVDIVNSVNRETYSASTPGEFLKVENVGAVVDEVVITYPGEEALDELLDAIALLQGAGKKRIYVKEGEDERREYVYQLSGVFKKYGTIQTENGGLTDRQEDEFLDEVVMLGYKLEPTDREKLIKDFLANEYIERVGWTEESISLCIKRLSVKRAEEEQREAYDKMQRDAQAKREVGDIVGALNILESGNKEVRLKDKETEFSSLLQTTTEELVKLEEEALPGSLDIDIKINGEDVLLPGSAISVIAAPTGHGKTVFLINSLLNVARKNPDKKYILFSYEERATTILQYALNTFVNIELNASDYKGKNRRVLKDYFKGSKQYLQKGGHIEKIFEERKAEFFKTYIEPGRILIKGVNLNSEDLGLAITYLKKKEPNLGGVFIDYFQLLNLSGKKKKEERINNRQEEVKKICFDLNEIAKSTGLPLLLGAQFNREVFSLLDLHAQKLREAADIEQIVSLLLGAWNIEKKPVGKPDEREIKLRTKDRTEGLYIEVLKSRDLPTGLSDVLEYNGNTGKLSNGSTQVIKATKKPEQKFVK